MLCLYTKTRSCRFYGAGLCTKGDLCSFAHGRRELRAAPDLSRTKICPGRESCRDELCMFAHDASQRRRLHLVAGRRCAGDDATPPAGVADGQQPTSRRGARGRRGGRRPRRPAAPSNDTSVLEATPEAERPEAERAERMSHILVERNTFLGLEAEPVLLRRHCSAPGKLIN